MKSCAGLPAVLHLLSGERHERRPWQTRSLPALCCAWSEPAGCSELCIRTDICCPALGTAAPQARLIERGGTADPTAPQTSSAKHFDGRKR